MQLFMEEFESYNGQFRDGDRVYVDKPLPEIIEAENSDVVTARDIQKILPELLLDF